MSIGRITGRGVFVEKTPLEEGFYEAHLRNEILLCYVYKTKKGVFADLPSGETKPVSSGPRELPYILSSNLHPTDPMKYAKNALDLIKFVFTNLGKFEVSRRINAGELEIRKVQE